MDLSSRIIDQSFVVRPKACEFIKFKLRKSRNIVKSIEVCGFSSENVKKYITRFFNCNEDTTKADKVFQIVSNSNDLSVMASVPVFLWIMCNIYNEDLVTQDIQSKTELYLYTCLVFMRNHMRTISGLVFENLFDLVNNKEFLKILKTLATLSLQTYINHKVLFDDEDVQNLQCSVHLEQTGFIVKSNGKGALKKSVYQFKHLVLQEFLCSLYLSVTKNIKPYLSNRELASCTPTLLGIDRLKNEQSILLFTTFFKNLVKTFKADRKLLETINVFKSQSEKSIYKRYVLGKLAELTVPTSMISEEELVFDQLLSSECLSFLSSVYESKYVNTRGKTFRTVRIIITDNVTDNNLKLVLFLLNILNIHQCNYLCYNGIMVAGNGIESIEVPKDVWKIVLMRQCQEVTTVFALKPVESFHLLLDASKLYFNLSVVLPGIFVIPEDIKKITSTFQLDLVKMNATQQMIRELMLDLHDVFDHVLKSNKQLYISVDNRFRDNVQNFLSDNFDVVQISQCVHIA